jgi:Flp pilus assembly protein TadG
MKIIPAKSSGHSRQHGIAVVECVIALPVVIFLIMAVAELGNAILQYNTLTQAVRFAARYTAENAGAGTGVIQLDATKIAEGKNFVANGTPSGGSAILPGLDPSNVSVTLVGGNVRITVAYPYQPLFAGNIPALVGDGSGGGAFTMKAEMIMKVL